MFLVHRAESGMVLAEELARLLSDPLEDPFALKIVAYRRRVWSVG